MTDRTDGAPPSALIYLAWLVPGLPLVWGVWQTLLKVVELFR